MKKALTLVLFVLTNLIFSQSKTITGVIKDATSSLPIESVSISISNSSLGTISNEEGKFRIILPENKNTLEFSHLYYTLESYAVKANDTENRDFFNAKNPLF